MSHIFNNTVKFSICYWESERDVHWKSSWSQNYPGTFHLVPRADDRVWLGYPRDTLLEVHLSFSLTFYKSFMIFVDPLPRKERNIGYILFFTVVSSWQKNWAENTVFPYTTTAPTPNFPYHQHPPPEWDICDNQRTYADTSLPPKVHSLHQSSLLEY